MSPGGAVLCSPRVELASWGAQQARTEPGGGSPEAGFCTASELRGFSRLQLGEKVNRYSC